MYHARGFASEFSSWRKDRKSLDWKRANWETILKLLEQEFQTTTATTTTVAAATTTTATGWRNGKLRRNKTKLNLGGGEK